MESQGHIAAAQHNYGFELVHTVSAHDGSQVCEYKSKSTGLTVLFAPVGGPYIRASFVFPTEYFDNEGLPSAVESLIFMGSKKYPYTNVLNALAENYLDTRMTGYTDADYTSFELTCAESRGFLNLLPLYLDHIFNPAFTEEAFLTEIHHIDGEGKDGGSYYEQAVGLERLSSYFPAYQILNKAMYPHNSGYSYNSNGNPVNIRKITLEKLKEYHRKYYHVNNLKVNIIGNIDHQSVFQALAQFDKKPEGVFERPWQTPLPPLSENKNLVYQYPTEEEESNEGFAYVGWRGPSECDQYMFTAVRIFLKYLTDSPDGRIFKEFVDIPDRCASQVYFTDSPNSETCFYLFLDDVPVDKLPTMREKVFKLLANCINNFDESDMEILQIAIQSEKFLYLEIENEHPHNKVEFRLAEYAVHGTTAQDLESKINPFKHLNELLNESKAFWINLAKKFLIESNHVALQCFPNKSLNEEIKLNEETRIKNQIEKLGAETLKQYDEILQAAKVSQKKVPKELIDSIVKVEPASFNFFKLTRFSSDIPNQRIDLSNTPVFTYFDDVKESGIVSIFALLDSSKVTVENRICLPLLLQTIFQSPMRKNGSLVTKINVQKELKKCLITSKTSFGLNARRDLFQCGKYSNTLMIMIQVESDNYDVGIGWMRDVLFNLEFTLEEVKIGANKILEEIKLSSRSGLRSGGEITRHLFHDIIYVEDCNIVQNGLSLQEEFLTNVTEQTINTMKTTWRLLTDPKNVALHIVGSLNRIQEPERALNNFLPEHIKPFQNKPQVVSDVSFLSKMETNCAIVGLDKEQITASHLILSVESINSYDNPDLSFMLLYVEYWNINKGPINKRLKKVPTITMKLEPHKGLLSLRFNNAQYVFEPYNKIKEKILDQIRNKRWNDDWFNKAKTVLVRRLINKEVAVYDVTRSAVQSYFQKVDYTYNRTLLHKVLSATTSDLDSVGSKYLLELFNQDRAKIFILTVPSKTQEIADSFKRLNFNVEVFSR